MLLRSSFALLFLATATRLLADRIEAVFQAEDARLIGRTRIVEALPEGSRRLVATDFITRTDALDFTVRVPSAGDYLLALTYACDADKRIPVTVNDSFQGSRLFPKTTGFTEARFGRIRLRAGDNTIRLGTDYGYADIDFIRLSPARPPLAFNLSTAPVNPHASPAARTLFTRLTHEFTHRTFAGQHESAPDTPSRLDQVARLTDGKAPALLGLDLIFYSQAWNRPDGDGAIKRALDWSRQHRGLVTLSWHWLAPFDGGPLVWDSFSTNKTTFDVSRLADETSAEYAAILRDLDRIAEKLKILRDAGVPVLWRPLHEAEGGWFWWGARGPDATKRLYQLMFDRFTRHHRLDNLLWVWTSTDDPGALAWYPGDHYVDFIANDLYAPAGARGDFFTVFDELRERYHGRKPLALGECGVLPDMTPESPWLWFLVWDDIIARPVENPPRFVARTYADPRVITLQTLAD